MKEREWVDKSMAQLERHQWEEAGRSTDAKDDIQKSRPVPSCLATVVEQVVARQHRAI